MVENTLLKGQCHEIFCFWFFSWISFPQASDYTIRAVSNFLENSRRYSQLKVCHHCQRHWWQMKKTFKQKNFNNFVWTPLGGRVNIYINFCLQVHFKVSAARYCCHSHLCQRHRWQICRRCRWYRWQFANAVVDTGDKFVAGVVDTGGKFATGVVDTGGAPWLANISANFRKKSIRSKWNTLGLGGKLIHEKNQKQKSRDTVP
jgi:hypothetical protein